MRWHWLQLASAVLVPFASPAIADRQTYDSGFEPPHLSPFPRRYEAYQILPFSFSPDGTYAFIYPKRAVVYELDSPELLLIAVKPFRLMKELPLYSSLAGNAKSYYAVNWSVDSSAVVFVQGTKWGPEKVFLVPIQAGQAGRPTDLTQEVRKQVTPDFRQSKAARYNDTYDFIFESEDRQVLNEWGDTFSEKGWDVVGNGRVMIDCTCTTDPKEIEPHSWTIRFKGIWDIGSRRFLQKQFTRIARGAQRLRSEG